MDVIGMARELGKEIQKDQRYIKMQAVLNKNEADLELQKLIEQFNEKRQEINREVMKTDKDQVKLSALDAEFKGLYKTIMELPSMIEYNEAKQEFEGLLSFVSQIITESANGADPDLIEQNEDCGGDCSACKGCH